MLAFVIVLQVIVALFLILVVLLQPGNRGGSSAALGGAGSDTVFGARGANTFLSKITFGAAVAFMVTNFLLSYMSSSGGEKSVLDALEATKPSTTKSEEVKPSDNAEQKNEAAPDALKGGDGVNELEPNAIENKEATPATGGEALHPPDAAPSP
jgi:preprotein translocase subunit SecG